MISSSLSEQNTGAWHRSDTTHVRFILNDGTTGGQRLSSGGRAKAEAVELPYCAGSRRTESRTYMVFFDQHSAVVGGRNKTVVEEFAAYLERERSYYDEIIITIIPGKDTSEVLSRDRGLDLRRGQAIERLLRSLAPYARIDIRPHGTDHSPVPTDALTPEPQNRSVYLAFLGGKQIRPFAWQTDCMNWLRSHHCETALNAAQTAVCKQVEKVAHEFQA